MKIPKLRSRVGRFPWKFFLAVVVIVVFGSAGAVLGVTRWMERDLPPIERLQSYQPPLKSTVYDVEDRVIAEFFREHRERLELSQIPENLIQATIATEDKRFFSHWGVDLIGMARAFLTGAVRGGGVRGTSTITQQLARNMFLTHERSVERKLKEILLALRIERLHSKHEILEMYFNEIYYGDGSYGVASAARNFFGKEPAKLGLEEAALLAGLPANPARYAPRRHPAAATARRNHVLKRMYEEKIIGAAEYRRSAASPLEFSPTRLKHGRAPYFTEMVRRYMDEKYGSNLVYEGGLQIHTTLDLDLQEIAEESVQRRLAEVEKMYGYKTTYANWTPPEDGKGPAHSPYLQGAVVAMDPETGHVRALVGGRDFRQSPFNRAVQAQRQPGSSFKPFIFAAAIDNGFRPTDVVVDAPVTYTAGDGGVWSPKNYDHTFSGPVTLRYALQKSINIPAIKLLRKLGVSQVASYARRMGIKSPIGQNLSLALGTSEVNLLELTSAYAVFANEGIRTEPLFVLEVRDAEGNVLEKNGPRPVDVLSPETAAVVTSMMQSVVNHGTGYPARARGLTIPAAGKTGTTDDYTDAWFVGYTPNLAVGIWVGFDKVQRMGRSATGAVAALPIWTDVMLAWEREGHQASFPMPAGTVTRQVCSDTGLLATDVCPEVMSEVFTFGTEPGQFCDIHVGLPRQPGEPGEPGQAPRRQPREPRGPDAEIPNEDFRTLDERNLEPETIRL